MADVLNDGRTERPVVVFTYRARFGHFLRAEASASALTYPIPPRTALLGLIGAILGLLKDATPDALGESLVAVAGAVPQTHWHRAKLRKDPPAALPWTVRAGDAGTRNPKPEQATLPKQEWLFNPRYQVVAALPEASHEAFVERLRKRRWHFSPCMGLSEMGAQLDLAGVGSATRLPPQSQITCASIARRDLVTLRGRAILQDSNAARPPTILTVRLPRRVTTDRVFEHADYILERSGAPLPLTANEAWELSAEAGGETVLFL